MGYLLKAYAHQQNVIVLALPRGGVPVAYEIVTFVVLDFMKNAHRRIPAAQTLSLDLIKKDQIKRQGFGGGIFHKVEVYLLLFVFVVGKLDAPGHEYYAIGHCCWRNRGIKAL